MLVCFYHAIQWIDSKLFWGHIFLYSCSFTNFNLPNIPSTYVDGLFDFILLCEGVTVSFVILFLNWHNECSANSTDAVLNQEFTILGRQNKFKSSLYALFKMFKTWLLWATSRFSWGNIVYVLLRLDLWYREA